MYNEGKSIGKGPGFLHMLGSKAKIKKWTGSGRRRE
jgi:hypothetical protein